MAGRKRSYGRGNQDGFPGDSFKRMRGPHPPQFMGGGGGFMQPQGQFPQPPFSEDGPFPAGSQVPGPFQQETFSEPYFPEPGQYSEPSYQEPGPYPEPGPFQEPNYNEGFGMDGGPPPFYGNPGRGFQGRGMERGRGGRGRGFRGGPFRGGPGDCPPYMWMPPSMGPQWGPGQGNRRNFGRGKAQYGEPNAVKVENMTPDERLQRLWNEVRRHKRESKPMNTIEMLTNNIRTLKPKDELNYKVDVIHEGGHEPYITGALKFEDVFLARCTGSGKKDLKARVFQQAQNNLMHKTIEEIKEMEDPGVETIRAEYEASRQARETGKYNPEDVEKDLMMFVDILLNQRKKELLVNHPVLALEQASPKGHETKVRHVYRCETNKIATKKAVHTGHLDFGNIVLGRGQSLSRKQCKFLTYKDAMERITTKSIAELLKSLPEEEPSIYSMTFEDLSDVSNAPLKVRLTEFMNKVKESTDVSSLVNLATSQGLIVTTLVRVVMENDSTNIRGELYVGDIFIAKEDTTTRRDSINGVRKSAWKILQNSTAECLMSSRRLTEKDVTHPTIFNIRFQGAGRMIETNAATLVQYGHNPTELLKKKVKDMVLIEGRDGSKDRLSNAFFTLRYSCCQNNIVMQWDMKAVKDNVIRCEMSLQGVKMGMSYGPDILTARNLAAADILYKMYQTNDVLKTFEEDDNNDSQRWILWDTVKAEAQKLREAGGGGLQPEPQNGNLHGSRLEQYGVGNVEDFSEQDPETDGDTDNLSDKKKKRKQADPYIVQYIVSRLEKFAARKNCEEEIVFGPGMDYVSCSAMKVHARQMKLKYDSKLHDKKCYTILYHCMSWPEIATICKRKRTSFGKFKIYSRAELPKYADVSSSIFKSPELVQASESENADDGN